MKRIIATARRWGAGVLRVADDWKNEALIFAGVASIAYGCWLVYAPAGFIAGGLLTLAMGVVAARAGD